VVTTEELGQVPLFAALAPVQREQLSRVAADISLAAGEYAAHQSDERALFAVLEGRIEPVKRVEGIERVVGERRPGDVFGEFPLALGTVFPVGFRAAESSRVMRIEAPDYHAVAAVAPDLAKEVGRLAAHRMSGLRGLQSIAAEPPPPRVGHRWDASCTELRRFLDRNQVTYKWLTPDTPDAGDPWGGPLPADEDLPAIRVVDGKTRSIVRIDAATRQVHLDGGDVLRARTIILACGVTWRHLSIDGFDRLAGKGISYGAARSEAPNTHGLDVHILGAGNSAGQAALFSSTHARSVTILCRGDNLNKSMSRYLIDQLVARPNIRARFGPSLRLCTATSRSRRSTSATPRRQRRPDSSRAGCSSSSARMRRRPGFRPRSRSTTRVTYSPAPTCARRGAGRSTATHTSWRRVFPESSPAATCDSAR
jgi:CRP-like cAMP-binding protein